MKKTQKSFNPLGWTSLLKGSVVILILLSFACIGFFSLRGYLFAMHTTPKGEKEVPPLRVSASTKKMIDEIVKKSAIITAIQVSTVDFQHNIRPETSISIDNPLVQEIRNKQLDSKVFETPLFTENKKNNAQVIRLINGEFVCVPYRDYITYQTSPTLEQYVSDVCMIGIPPFYGQFSGILTLFLQYTPTEADSDQLFLLSKDISLNIYDQNKYRYETKN